MAVGIHGDDFLLVAPLREGPDLGRGFGVCEVWLVGDVEVLACNSKSIVDGIRTAMGTNS